MTSQVADPEKEPLKSALEAQRESEEFKTRLIEGSRDCLKVLDLEGRLLSMNAGGMAALEICDLEPVLGTSWIDFWQGADRDAARQAVETAREGGVGRFVGYFPTRQTGQPRWWDVVVNAISGRDGKPEKLLAVSRDVTELKQNEQLLRRSREELERQIIERSAALTKTGEVLREIVEGVESKVGEQFFPSLVRQLATALDVDYAYISELSEDGTVFRSRAGWGKGRPLPLFDVPAHGPCETVLTRKCIHHPDQLRALYPDVQLIQDIGAVSYCGVPVVDASDRILGHLAIMDSNPMPDHVRATSILGIFATRAAAEFERLSFERAIRKSDITLRLIDEGTAATTVVDFFHSLVKSLAGALQTKYAFVSKFVEGNRTRVRTLAFWNGGEFLKNFEYDLPHTPCERVLAGEVCLFPEKVQDLFPDHRDDLAALGVESYLAIPVMDRSGAVLGHLAVMDIKPMRDDPRVLSVFKIFGQGPAPSWSASGWTLNSRRASNDSVTCSMKPRLPMCMKGWIHGSSARIGRR